VRSRSSFSTPASFFIARDRAEENALMEGRPGGGADDVIASEHGFEVRCAIHAFDRVAHALESKGIKADSAEIAYIPNTTVAVADLTVAATLVKLHDALEEIDDVQQVFSNEETESRSRR
jgi:transcriptional/translational regulatory protein YebC/TACO1